MHYNCTVSQSILVRSVSSLLVPVSFLECMLQKSANQNISLLTPFCRAGRSAVLLVPVSVF